MWAVDLIKGSDIIVIWFSLCNPEAPAEVDGVLERVFSHAAVLGHAMPLVLLAGSLSLPDGARPDLSNDSLEYETEVERSRISSEHFMQIAASTSGIWYYEFQPWYRCAALDLLSNCLAILSRDTNTARCVYTLRDVQEIQAMGPSKILNKTNISRLSFYRTVIVFFFFFFETF